jgi:hypothetical protein
VSETFRASPSNCPFVCARRLLANLWARGAALQCCFRQESIDFLIVTYHGPIRADAPFDPSYLCATVVSMKFKGAADTRAESAVRPIGVPRDIYQPLPYLAVILQLGTETNHKATGTRFEATASPAIRGVFEGLWNKWTAAKDTLANYQKQQTMEGRKVETDPRITEMQKAVGPSAKAQVPEKARSRGSSFSRLVAPRLPGVHMVRFRLPGEIVSGYHQAGDIVHGYYLAGNIVPGHHLAGDIVPGVDQAGGSWQGCHLPCTYM